jgi:hypothetical protein
MHAYARAAHTSACRKHTRRPSVRSQPPRPLDCLVQSAISLCYSRAFLWRTRRAPDEGGIKIGCSDKRMCPGCEWVFYYMRVAVTNASRFSHTLWWLIAAGEIWLASCCLNMKMSCLFSFYFSKTVPHASLLFRRTNMNSCVIHFLSSNFNDNFLVTKMIVVLITKEFNYFPDGPYIHSKF